MGHMNYQETTMIPNIILDSYLKTLSGKELKVLVVIIRQTLGWVDKKGNRKKRDWISQKYFVNKTGLSRKSISISLQLLIKKQLILSENIKGEILNLAENRKKAKRIYYALHPNIGSKNFTNIHHELRTTKLKPNKTNLPLRKQTDRERLLEILQLMKQDKK